MIKVEVDASPELKATIAAATQASRTVIPLTSAPTGRMDGDARASRAASATCRGLAMVTIRIDSSGLKKLEKQLDRMAAKLPQAIARGLNEGGDKVRTQVQHALQKQTSLVKYSSVTSRVRTMRGYGASAPKSGIGPVGPGSLSYSIIVAGHPPTKPKEFRVRVANGQGGGVTIIMWNSPHKFKRSFQQKFKLGLRARLGAARDKIRSFRRPEPRQGGGQG